MADEKWFQAFAMVYAAACPKSEVAADDPLGMAKEVVASIKQGRRLVTRIVGVCGKLLDILAEEAANPLPDAPASKGASRG